jgi:hypothetical protein
VHQFPKFQGESLQIRTFQILVVPLSRYFAGKNSENTLTNMIENNPEILKDQTISLLAPTNKSPYNHGLSR